MYLLDSDILIDFFKKRPETQELIIKLRKKDIPRLSILSVTELRAGWNDKETQQLLPLLYKAFKVESITIDIAECAGKLLQDYKQKGLSLGIIDVLIASTALKKKYELITRNIKHYPFPELKLYKI